MQKLSSVLLLAAIACSGTVVAEGPIDWVWSGAVTDRTAIVKAKVRGEAGPPRLVVAGRELEGEGPSAGGVTTFRLTGLAPESRVDYEVVAGNARLGGTFRTFPTEPTSFRFAFGSCARTGSNHRVFETIEGLDARFFLHMGDFHYENLVADDPDDYRDAFDEVLRSERQSSLYRSLPIAYVWDDHDYGPNDSDSTHAGRDAALRVYDEVVPHYPLEREGNRPRDLHQAFTVGRVRFLLTDVRSHRVPDDRPDGPDKSMLGEDQREWLLGELEAARDRYALVVWVNAVPWIVEPGSGHGWGRYDWERRYIADRIRDAGMVERLLMLSGDGHMVAIDDGTNSNFATDAPPGEPGFPVMHAAPLDRYARHKGGPYSHGKAGRRVLFGLVQIQQFGLAEIEDDGEVLTIALSGRDEDGDLLKNMILELRCDGDACRPVAD